ncbi:protein huluwa [Stigmatopora nigra]
MSHPRQSILPTPDLIGGNPITSLTLVVLLLIPAVVVLLMLNCLFLGYKLLIFSKARFRPQHREDADDMRLPDSGLHRTRGSPEADICSTRRVYMSLSEPALHQPPITSSRERIWLLRPGSGPLWAQSSIRVPGSSTSSSYLAADGRHSASVSFLSSDSEADIRGNLVPPNSPTCIYKEAEHADSILQSSMYGMLPQWNLGAPHLLDKLHMECESDIQPPPEVYYPNTSGLDTDFGASAGVSLRILSADSDGLSTGLLASGLEWDYYDPCYVRQNHVPKHKHHPRPMMHTKQYWV